MVGFPYDRVGRRPRGRRSRQGRGSNQQTGPQGILGALTVVAGGRIVSWLEPLPRSPRYLAPRSSLDAEPLL